MVQRGVFGAGVLFIVPRNGYARAALTGDPCMAKKARPTSTKKSRSAAKPRAQTKNLLQQMGVLRVVLVALTIVDMLAAPRPGTLAVYSGWEMLPTLILPVLAPILLQVLLLDALMGRVLMSSAKGAERLRYRRIVTVNLVFSVALVLWWLPYFLKLFAR
jgi:hypothetical protein